MFQNKFINFFAQIYQWGIHFFSNWQSLFIFLLRLIWGHQFFLAGLGKLQNIDATVVFFTSFGFPIPTFVTWLVALCEFSGGLGLLFGLASRFFGLLLSIIMLVAYSTAHAHVFGGFVFLFDPSLLVKEAPFAFLLTSLIVLIFGPGKISLDGWIKRVLMQKHHFY